MKTNKFLLKAIIFSFLISFSAPLFAEDTTPLPYDDKEFPQGLKDLRRFEIITLGAMPFVTLNTTLVYSGLQYVAHDFDAAYSPNIFAASTYTPEEQKKIILTSVGVCIGVGLTDYVIQLIKRSKKKKVNEVTYEDLYIYPVSEDPEATPIEIPETQISEQEEILVSDDNVIEVED